MTLVVAAGYFAARALFGPAVRAIEAVDPSVTGYLGGFGLPIVFSWFVGGALAAGAAWAAGKISLGLRADYLAIATLGISEIIVAFLKYEEWLSRGVKNVFGLPRPVPYEVDLQNAVWFQEWAATLGVSRVDLSSIVVKLCYAALFTLVLAVLMWLSEAALRAPWGRMMRAIRDNETAAEAMGKDVTARHLQVFVLGSAVIGIAGAMLATPGRAVHAHHVPPVALHLPHLGHGHRRRLRQQLGRGAGGFVVWYFWVEAEPMGLWLMEFITSPLAPDNPVRSHLMESAAHMRLVVMGLVLLLVLRFAPRGLIPEERR